MSEAAEATAEGTGAGSAPVPLDREKLAAARLWAAGKFPYLAAALFASPVVPTPGSGTVSVDEAWRLYVDPRVVSGWTPEELGSVMVHHAGHLLRDHAQRARSLGVGPEQAADWVDAADAEINDDFKGTGLRQPGNPVMPGDLGCAEGKLAEEYFHATRESPRGRRPTPDRSADRCGSGSNGQGSSSESARRPNDDSGISPGEADLLRSQVAADLLTHARSQGSVPAGLRRWAEEILHPRVDWRQVLAAELRRGVADVAGSVDYSYVRPSRRAHVSPGVILPALRRPVPEVAVVCDTSGSMSERMLGQVLAEIEGILTTVGVRRQNLRVLAVDTAVQVSRRVSHARQVELLGGGGTDMGAGLEAAARLRPRPAIIVVLTDGRTPWPSDPPKGIPVVVGLLGEHTPTPPKWARSVRIDEDR